MPGKQQLVDTNVLVRFFTGEPPTMAAKARQLVARADSGDVILVALPVIVAETFYTLESFYQISRAEVATKLLSFLQSRGIEALESDRVVDALKRCHDQNAHFADAYLAAAAAETGILHHREILLGSLRFLCRCFRFLDGLSRLRLPFRNPRLLLILRLTLPGQSGELLLSTQVRLPALLVHEFLLVHVHFSLRECLPDRGPEKVDEDGAEEQGETVVLHEEEKDGEPGR